MSLRNLCARTRPAPALQLQRTRPNTRRTLTFSVVDGARHPPLDPRTLPEYFAESIVRPHGARPALIAHSERPRAHGGSRSSNMGIETHLAWDFGEFDRHVQALARGLLGLGVRKGDRVAVLMGNNSAYASLQWACASVGAILVTLNPAYRVPELVNTLNMVGVSHLFVVPRIRSSAYIRMLADALPALQNSEQGDIQVPALPALRHIIVVNDGPDEAHFRTVMDIAKCTVDFREVLVWREDGVERRRVEELTAALDKDDVINLQFTSGTTGMPKAVSLTHHNLLNNGLQIGRSMRLTSSDVLWNLAAWTHGAAVVYPSPIYDPRAIVDALAAERCTALHGVPTHFLGVLAEVQRRRDAGTHVDTRALRTGIAAGSPIPIDLMKQLIAKLNLTDLTITYGMSDPVSFQTTPDDPLIKRVETVGRILPHTRAKIVDREGRIVPVGTPGEILVAGYLLQKGYWGDADRTDAIMQRDEDGTMWIATGDEGIMDEEGYLQIVGRIKDIIIRGGENLFPVQIENVLTAHPEVCEAAAISVADERLGEVVGAWVVREPNTALSREAVRAFVASNMNPRWMCSAFWNAPAWVWFIGEDGLPAELPKTAWSAEQAKRGEGR
ncbi:acyl-CoA synthetase [Amylocystis lapponica]|nr:acyl-CoA synthetase [Amylocystis lapponica]